MFKFQQIWWKCISYNLKTAFPVPGYELNKIYLRVINCFEYTSIVAFALLSAKLYKLNKESTFQNRYRSRTGVLKTRATGHSNAMEYYLVSICVTGESDKHYWKKNARKALSGNYTETDWKNCKK